MSCLLNQMNLMPLLYYLSTQTLPHQPSLLLWESTSLSKFYQGAHSPFCGAWSNHFKLLLSQLFTPFCSQQTLKSCFSLLSRWPLLILQTHLNCILSFLLQTSQKHLLMITFIELVQKDLIYLQIQGLSYYLQSSFSISPFSLQFYKS